MSAPKVPAPPTMSPRVQDLRDDLVSKMPIEKSSARAELASKYITDVMIQYLTWQSRLVRPRPRSVIVWPEVLASPYYHDHKEAIERLKAEFDAGADMNPALSHGVRRNAYAGKLPTKTAAISQDQWVKKAWEGKDRLRVLGDVHHIHLGPRLADGSVDRTGPLLFVGITAAKVFFLAIGDHKSFVDGSITKIMYDKLDSDLASSGGGIGLSPGLGVSLGGTQIKDTLGAIDIVRQIEHTDKELDDKGAGTDYKIRMEWDDVIVLDPQGSVVRRFPGLL